MRWYVGELHRAARIPHIVYAVEAASEAEAVRRVMDETKNASSLPRRLEASRHAPWQPLKGRRSWRLVELG